MLMLVSLLAGIPSALALDNGVGRLPSLGWNSWNAYGCDITEAKFLDAANAIVSKGFKDKGYNYVNIDDCWSIKTGRDSTTGQIIPDSAKFPNGISGLASKIHGMGLKIGIYSSAGDTTCAGYPASLGHESTDASTFASWGIDLLKYDNCGVPKDAADDCNACYYDDVNVPNRTCTSATDQQNLCPAGYDYSQSKTAKRYQAMRDALAATGRQFYYNLCEWGKQDVWTWGNSTANAWRTTNDINATWDRIVAITNQNAFLTNYGGFTGHNDWDMLEVGNGELTDAESRSHFALWALGKSPLLIGTDLTNISQNHIDILQNGYLLNFNQDPNYGIPAAPYKWGANPDWTFDSYKPPQYWSGDSSIGRFVALFNLGTSTTTMTANFGEIPGLTSGGTYRIINVWTSQDMGCKTGSIDFQVEAHDTAVFIAQQCFTGRRSLA